MENENKSLNLIVWSVILVVAIAVLILISPFGVIDAGHQGVRLNFGNVIGDIAPGLYWKVPIVQSVEVFDVRTQKEQVDVEAASSDLQTVHSSIAVNYNVNPDKVADIYKTIGRDYKTVVIDPAIQETVKAATAKYTAEQLITQREKVKGDIISALTDSLSTRFIVVSSVSITNFDFSQSFNAAIEAKVTAEQSALAAKNKLEQVKFEAEQTIASAQAQAEAIKIQAQAINSQGGADYVLLKKTEKWDGHGCTSYCGLEASTGLLINGK